MSRQFLHWAVATALWSLSMSAVAQMVTRTEGGISARVVAAPLHQVLQEFSDASGVEILISGTAEETISVEFEELATEEALGTILGGRSSIGFYSEDQSPGEPPRLTQVWVFKGVARPGQAQTLKRAESAKGKARSVKRSDPFEALKRQALTGKDPESRKRAIEALITSDETKAKGVLLQVLNKDKDAQVRLAALENLLWYDEEAPRESLVRAALKDESSEVRRMALEEAFIDQAEDNKEARRVLTQAMKDKDPSVRLLVVEALGGLALSEDNNEPILQVLGSATNDADEDVRLTLIEYLEENEMREPLQDLTNDESLPVRDAATEALDRLRE